VLARAVTFALVGLEPRRVEVEAHIQGSKTPSLTIVGLADRACQEAKQPSPLFVCPRCDAVLRGTGVSFFAG
jgi:hypothetical protein